VTTISTDRDGALLDLAAEQPLVPSAPAEDVWAIARAGADVSMLCAAVLVSSLVAQTAGGPSLAFAPSVVFVALAGASLAWRGAYAHRLRIDMLDDLRTIVVGTSLAAMAVISARELLTTGNARAGDVVRAWLFAIVYVGAGRVALNLSQSAARSRGVGLRPTLIIGAGEIGQLTARRLEARPELGLKPVGFLDKEPLVRDGETLPLPVFGASWDVERVIEEEGIRQVVVTFSKAPHDVLLRLVRRCEKLGVDVAYVPRLFERMTVRPRIEHIGALPLLSVAPAMPKGWQFTIKHVSDRVIAAAALLLVLPILVGAAIAVRRSLGRPILFRQIRVGRDDRPFEMLKFRTMKDAEPGALDAIAPEGRRTRVGEFLRRTSIDELPQLVNVLRGEMSLVGPRPERQELVDQFVDRIYRYSDRHRVKAGITGWAQIHGFGRGSDRFGDISLSERVEWDNYYIENWSLWLDVKILLLTSLAALRFAQRV
jgi:exopolysaccharide biosynthesis polyprenyl glycosylphosphotransferase